MEKKAIPERREPGTGTGTADNPATTQLQIEKMAKFVYILFFPFSITMRDTKPIFARTPAHAKNH